MEQIKGVTRATEIGLENEKRREKAKSIRTNNEEYREEYQRRRICNKPIKKAKRKCIDRRIKEIENEEEMDIWLCKKINIHKYGPTTLWNH
ncbi:hypothetical protein QE152_g4898 [Popillia japonica]|uniref:Uncharacterized protein n=1 Tax=Popillia japonica TaxID=7064 RepID=A0AAW1MZ46_POPJA